MSQNLVIVESPAKAKTIEKFLGKGYQVLASYGHVRDLPSKDGSVDVDNDFLPKYVVSAKAKKQLTILKQALKKADNLVLATDPDREGEAIAWQLAEELKQKDTEELSKTWILRRALNGVQVVEAMEMLIKRLKATPSNAEFLLSMKE